MASSILIYIRKVFVFLLIIPVKAYQYIISPYTPASCRHVPTCSNYAIEALKTHGVFIGLFLSVKRILRCHPWGTHGMDPVPPRGFWRKSTGNKRNGRSST